MAKMKTEKITTRFLERVLKNPVFTADLEEAIRVTQKTGYEVSFEIQKVPGEKGVVMPDLMDIGENNCVGGRVGEERIYRQFEETYGRPAVVEIDGLEICDPEYGDFVKEQMSDGTGHLYVFSNREGSLGERGYPSLDLYTLIHIHTHPGSNAFPSVSDLKYAFSQKQDSNEMSEWNFVAPIGLVVASKPKVVNRKVGPGYNVCFYKGNECMFDERKLAARGVFVIPRDWQKEVKETFGIDLVGGYYSSKTKRYYFYPDTCGKQTRLMPLKQAIGMFAFEGQYEPRESEDPAHFEPTEENEKRAKEFIEKYKNAERKLKARILEAWAKESQ